MPQSLFVPVLQMPRPLFLCLTGDIGYDIFYPMNKDLIRLQAELLCEAPKRRRHRRFSALISALAREMNTSKPSKREQAQLLAEHLFKSSDATSQDIEIVNNKVYISTPMYIDPVELSKRVLW